MKNLLNCHAIGLHSFPVSCENGLYRRVFYAAENHHLWRPVELAIHPHHVDITIRVLEGALHNLTYAEDEEGAWYKTFRWNSHILSGSGGFEHLGHSRLIQLSNTRYEPGQSVTMQACELHTVYVEQGKRAVWIVEEAVPTCEYFPINYSIHDLTRWTPEGLYTQVDDTVKQQYIGKYAGML